MIITPNDIRSVRPIAENVNDDKRMTPLIDECEKLFLIPAIGAKMYKSLDANPKPDNYDMIMNGGYYNDDNDYFPGLREAMGYLVYSRFVRGQNVNATAFGMVTKQGQFSEPVDERTIKNVANDAEITGLNYLQQTVDYINFGVRQSPVVRRIKFRAIG